MALVTREGFAKRLINSFGLHVSEHRMNALLAWQAAEGTNARFNPLATTMKLGGCPSTDFNRTGVQDYTTLACGVKATHETLEEPGHGYEAIVQGLKANASARQILQAVADSDWG